MKKAIPLLLAVFTYCVTFGQISPDTFNDFEDGTTQGWSNGGSSPNPPSNVPDGGPTGAGDGFLEEISSGGAGPGSRMIVFNTNAEWLGDYSSILDLSFDAKSPTNDDLFVRVAMEGGSDDSAICTTASVTVSAQSDWTSYTLNMDASSFTLVSGSNTIEEVLQEVTEIRILHSDTPSFIGQSIDATLHVDNISVTASISGVEDQLANTFQLYPSPAVNTLKLSAQISMDSYRIYNLLGARVAQGTIESTQQEIDVSALQTGTYLIEITAGDQTTTQKFLKK
ncbi:MAG: hypothetical protein Aureis2KO_14750 [Aureisphaera sp.]